MAQPQQNLQIDALNSQMTPTQGLVQAYSFGDITRVGNLAQGGQPPKNRSYNANEFLFQQSSGLNPFFKQPDTASKMFIG